MTDFFQNASHGIPLATAVAMTARYREKKATVLKSEYASVLPLSEAFERSAVDGLLANEECAGLRIYYGMDEQLGVHAILVGVNEEGEDILPTQAQLMDGGGPIEEAIRCPPICPPPSPLNGG